MYWVCIVYSVYNSYTIYLYIYTYTYTHPIYVAGHLAAVQYLSHREGCTADAMDSAATNGHLEVVQWLNENRHEGCTSLAMDSAASNGRLDILKYLTDMHVGNNRVSNRNTLTGGGTGDGTGTGGAEVDIGSITTVSGTPVITSRAIDLASEHGHLDVLHFIRDKYKSYITTIHSLSTLPQAQAHTAICPSRLAFDLAAGNGHVAVLDFLVGSYENLCSVASIELAARSGHVHVLQWFYEKFPEMFM